MRSRWLVLLALWLVTWIGCSSDENSTPNATGGSAQSAGGQAGRAGDSGAGESGAGGSATGGNSATGGVGMSMGGAPLPGAGGTSGLPSIPAGWTCIYFTYGDGKCDCGCGVVDSDCAKSDIAHCERCNSAGGCDRNECPGRIDPSDVTQCLPAPASWTCGAATYGDGTCHCGCGVVDSDCADGTAASCQECDVPGGCATSECGVDADDNAHCPRAPVTWTCSPRLYNDGSRCDCGCGAIDPDCDSIALDACERCDAPGSCASQACPAFIEPEFNGHCFQPDPPPGWTCAVGAYADGLACDCGCGIPDPDCRNNDLSTCVRCFVCGGHGICGSTIDPSDSTKCAPPPAAWICSADAYRDSVCDCGCGLLDSFCQDIPLRYVCGNFPIEGCAAGHREHVDPNNNPLCIINVPSGWTCDRTYYYDGLCDCGCGAPDLDCRSSDVSACEQCDNAGSCSSAACPGNIAPGDNAHCSK